MHAWIYAILNHLPGIIKTPGKWIIDRIWAVFDDGIRFAQWIRNGMRDMVERGKNFVRGVRDAINEAASTLRWIITVEIPRRVKKGFDDAVKWARDRANQLEQALRGLVSTVERALRTALNTLKGWVESAVKWLTGNVNTLLANAKRLLDRVFGTWGTPLKLAEWLIGALWTVALRYLYSNRERVASWILRSSASFATFLARTIEQILVRLL